jgi:hypothetical protein
VDGNRASAREPGAARLIAGSGGGACRAHQPPISPLSRSLSRVGRPAPPDDLNEVEAKVDILTLITDHHL